MAIPMAGIGVLAGLAAWLALAKFAHSMLCEAQADDPITFVGVGLLLVLLGDPASWIPR
jgi:hypothetical protein